MRMTKNLQVSWAERKYNESRQGILEVDKVVRVCVGVCVYWVSWSSMVRWDPPEYKGLSLLGKGLAAEGVIMSECLYDDRNVCVWVLCFSNGEMWVPKNTCINIKTIIFQIYRIWMSDREFKVAVWTQTPAIICLSSWSPSLPVGFFLHSRLFQLQRAGFRGLMNEGVHRETLTWVSAGHTSHAALTHSLFCERELGKGPLGWHCTTQLGPESERSVSRVNDGTRDGRSGIKDAECSRIAFKHLWCKASGHFYLREGDLWGGSTSSALSIDKQRRTTSDKRDKTQRVWGWWGSAEGEGRSQDTPLCDWMCVRVCWWWWRTPAPWAGS